MFDEAIVLRNPSMARTVKSVEYCVHENILIMSHISK